MYRWKNISQLSILVTVVLVMRGIKSIAQKTEFGARVMPTILNFEVLNASGGVIEGEATV